MDHHFQHHAGSVVINVSSIMLKTWINTEKDIWIDTSSLISTSVKKLTKKLEGKFFNKNLVSASLDHFIFDEKY
jgi:hypothetical protein